MNATRPTTIDEIETAVRSTGSHWFDRDTMRFFGTKVYPEVIDKGRFIYFVTSEKPPHGPRAYSIRQFDPETATIKTCGEFCGYKSRQAAYNAARGQSWRDE
jgi:endonuclease YncB( thermonuclease family)